MLREIRLYGALAKFIGKRVLRADVASAAEAVRFLVTNWPQAFAASVCVICATALAITTFRS